MKRNIIIIGLVVVMLTASITELIIHNNFYKGIHDDLLQVRAYIEQDDGDLEDSGASELIDDIIERFVGHRWLTMSISNHAHVVTASEHLVRLKQEIALGRREEATVQVAVTIVYFEDLMGDINPTLTNIF